MYLIGNTKRTVDSNTVLLNNTHALNRDIKSRKSSLLIELSIYSFVSSMNLKCSLNLYLESL